MRLLEVYGIVQGVGFRPFVWKIAKDMGLNGYVMNRGGYVEIALEGPDDRIEQFILKLKEKFPSASKIDNIKQTTKKDYGFDSFGIEESRPARSSIPSIIPPDIAICRNCLKELFSKDDRRYLYPFINCTACGPRFTIIKSVPYDRNNTTIDKFTLCDFCRGEYSDPPNRRYHAEPVACPQCGPDYLLISDGKVIEKGSIKKAAELIDKGNAVAIKGYGGFHIACDATSREAVDALREKLGRPYQPFAVMVRDISFIEKNLSLTKEEMRLLASPASPIVVLYRKEGKDIAENVAPGLETVGVMLPYSPLHHILFFHSSSDCFVMTSANFPGNPMIIDLKEAKRGLNFVNHFLTHDLEIRNRCDDSVIRDMKFIRRSRGYVPQMIDIRSKAKMLAFGAELNNVVSLSRDGKIVLSQHIGDTSNWDVMKFAFEAVDNLMNLLDVKFGELDYMLCDLHPQYNTSKVAREWSKKRDMPLVEIQHHFAHSFGLAGEYGRDEMVCIAADGAGYGLDGNIWGGEVLYSNRDITEGERLGHLEYQKMPGGDMATRYPLRMLVPLLETDDLFHYAKYFEGGVDEIDALKSVSQKHVSLTSSCGRILDAFAAMLELSFRRTYEGEGAMRFESLALKGSDLHIPLEVEDGVVKTGEFIKKMYGTMNSHSRKDIAMTVHKSIAHAFLEIIENNIDLRLPVGFSGGCAYNLILSDTLRKGVEHLGMDFLEHRLVPPGDGGISFGQSCARIE
ncbi:MAG: carbamoyltransferase HypF [Candidatus Methanofastidiosia archaeon]